MITALLNASDVNQDATIQSDNHVSEIEQNQSEIETLTI